jgi:hypothetical protein
MNSIVEEGEDLCGCVNMTPVRRRMMNESGSALHYITLGYVIQGLSPQLQHRRTIFLVRDGEGCPLFRQASTDVLTTGVTDDDDVPCSCAGVALQDLRFWHDIGIQLEVREQIVRKPLGDRHGAVQSSSRDHDFEPSGGAQD